MHSRKGTISNLILYQVKLAMAVAAVILFLRIPCYGITGINEGGTNTSQVLKEQAVKKEGEIPAAEKEQPVRFTDGKLSISISNIPLGKLMNEVAGITGVKVAWQDELGGNREKLVSVGFANLSIDDAVKNILQGESYLLFYASGDDTGQHVSRVLILPGNHEGSEQRSRSHADAGRGQKFVPPSLHNSGERYAMEIPEFDNAMPAEDFHDVFNPEEAELQMQFQDLPPEFMEQW